MDAATAAAVAALVVSILAMTIATAQVLQQYLNTGQLIRMCDGVVYGKMPGKGRRVWEYSQFRFRVVYSVPQISLRPSLWMDSLPQYTGFERGLLPLPDLRHGNHILGAHPFSFHLPGSSVTGQTRSAHSAIAGEACWVSFCRMAQNSCTNDLFYELLHCDADRCPSDLPVVPMQVSMRDIATIALMAGMRCTDASFEAKSIAMDGEAGTITSSWHPMLGSIIHFSPRNLHRPLGIRLGGGNIGPAWMTRMWDVATVAGRRYDARDRKTFEAYEGHSWVASSRGRSMVRASISKPSNSRSPVRSFRLRSSSPTQTLRRRRTNSVPSMPAMANGRSTSIGKPQFPGIPNPSRSDNRANHHQAVLGASGLQQLTRFAGRIFAELSTSNPEIAVSAAEIREQETSPLSLRGWRRHLRKLVSRKRGDTRQTGIKNQSDAYPTDVEGHGAITGSSVIGDLGEGTQNTVHTPGISQPSDRSRCKVGESLISSHMAQDWILPASGTRRMLDGRPLQQYIEEKKQTEQVRSRGGNLFLTWRSFSEEGSPTGDIPIGDDWHTSVHQLSRERSYSLIDKWRQVLNSRQQMRQEKDIQTEWEIETYYSGSRQSSIAASDRRRRASPSDTRSISRGSRTSGGSRRGSVSDRVKKYAHAARREHICSDIHAQTPAEEPLTVNLSSFSHSDWDENLPPQHHSIAYGHDPIQVNENIGTIPNPLDSTQTAYSESKSPDGESGDRQGLGTRRRKRVHYGASAEPHTTIVRDDQSPAVHRRGEEVNTDGGQLGAIRTASVNSEVTVEKVPHNHLVPSVEEGLRGILRQPRVQFPEDPNPLREGVAPPKDAVLPGIPSNARWTKISRRLVDVEALEESNERFDERGDYVIVLRVLTREEISILANRTREIREARELEWLDQEPAAELGGDKGSPNVVSNNESAQVRMGHSDDLDPNHIHRVTSNSRSDATNPADPGAESAASSTNWSTQSVYGSGEGLTISYSPDAMSDIEERHRGRSKLPKRPRFDTVSDISQSGNNPKVTIHTSRSASPRQVLGAQLKERLKEVANPTRRRASTRSPSSASRSSTSHSTDSEAVRRGDIRYKSYPDRLLNIPRSDGLGVHQSIASKGPSGNGVMKWLWICQADVLPGYFASPWHNHFSSETCLGAIVTVLEALEYYTDRSNMRYIDSLPWCEHWLYQGKTTFPSYAINAMGGIIIPTEDELVNFECFNSPMPAIQLLRSYHQQIDRFSYQGTNDIVIDRLTELMALDSWLSFCGRQPEIYDGRNNLLHSMPMLIQKIMTNFEYEFSHLDCTSADGGHQIVKELAGVIAHTLEKEMLSEEEQLFTVVAMLRAAKMALCCLNGPNTVKLRDIFIHDVQVYLV